MNVAGFESNEYFGFVVSDFGQKEMVQIAAGLAPALWDALSKGTGTEKGAIPGFSSISFPWGLTRGMHPQVVRAGGCLKTRYDTDLPGNVLRSSQCGAKDYFHGRFQGGHEKNSIPTITVMGPSCARVVWDR
jgi:hypothetical protein